MTDRPRLGLKRREASLERPKDVGATTKRDAADLLLELGKREGGANRLEVNDPALADIERQQTNPMADSLAILNFESPLSGPMLAD
jgi:hypothetical protein